MKKANAYPVFKLEKDGFGEVVNATIKTLHKPERNLYNGLAWHFLKAKSSKPSKKWLNDINDLIDIIGPKSYKSVAQKWLQSITELTLKETTYTEIYYGRRQEWTKYIFLEDQNKIFAKGVVWSLSRFYDKKTLDALALVFTKCFEKIPGVGPRAASVGNACIYTLAQSKGLDGISHLSRLKLKISQNSTRKLIEKYLQEASEERGMTMWEIEEMSIPDFGLDHGSKSILFGNSTLKITIEGINQVTQIWYDKNGETLKTVPAQIKTSKVLQNKLKKLKAEVKSIKKFYTAQRDRIDRMFIQEREFSVDQFLKYYFNHGLVHSICKTLVWKFKIGRTFQSYYFHNNEWKNLSGKVLASFEEVKSVKLWHPIGSTIARITKWRNLFEKLEIKQEVKQIYRELYLLTDAEVDTKVYSNRMAAHILKQYQFKALSAIRNWNYSLLGAYGDGRDSTIAYLNIPSHNLLAEYWINEVYDEDAISDNGILMYVSTDQVRFKNEDDETLDLIEIPAIVFSEVMRDTDLFVGVSSVGNDPQWRDNGGLVQYRDYWESYSFGDLTEVSKTRKKILENLIPRLKIKNVSWIEGKFLFVKGKIRTYKIHIGSTNILMEPNDQYLCIVPSRKKNNNLDKVFLPFEGDNGLSIILSKAFMLANDDEIEDETIVSQIVF